MSDNGGKGMLKSFDELVKLDVRPYRWLGDLGNA